MKALISACFSLFSYRIENKTISLDKKRKKAGSQLDRSQHYFLLLMDMKHDGLKSGKLRKLADVTTDFSLSLFSLFFFTSRRISDYETIVQLVQMRKKITLLYQ